MVYTDGPAVDNENRFITCPICENEEFSEDAKYCRICSQYRSNQCEGYYESDGYGNSCDELTQHDNPANARFCETCGRKTQFFIDGLLKTWEEIKGVEPKNAAQEASGFQAITQSVDDDDLPF